MANTDDTTTLNPITLILKCYEAIKDLKYLSWLQDLQILGSTITAATATYEMSHNWTYLIFAALGTFSVHTTAMYQEGIVTKKTNEAIVQAVNPNTSDPNALIAKVVAHGVVAVQEARKNNTSANSQVNEFIKSMEK